MYAAEFLRGEMFVALFKKLGEPNVEILIVTTRGRLTLGSDVLKHLGILPGGKIRLDLLPGGRAELSADRPPGSWRDLNGMLEGKGKGVRLSIEELNEAIAEAGVAAALTKE
jgi:hypothetical protein